jgi:hypothetical protein
MGSIYLERGAGKKSGSLVKGAPLEDFKAKRLFYESVNNMRAVFTK